MLASRPVEGAVVEITYDGSADRSEIAAVQERLIAAADQHGLVRLLAEMADDGHGGATPDAAWEDLESARLLTDVDRVAVLADRGWVERHGTQVAAAVDLEARAFPVDDRSAALAWLGTGPS